MIFNKVSTSVTRVSRTLMSFCANLSSQSLADTFGRKHNYLRISLTERCNLRCLYCMPEEGITLTKNSLLLNTNELKVICSLFVKSLGVNKIRLTGGEPLVRKDIIDIVRDLGDLRPYGLKTVAITTNGITLNRKCSALKQAGLNAVNISLDTLIPAKFEFITRRKGWENVMKSIESSLREKFDSVKINCVVIKGFNDEEIINFVELTRDLPIDVRFIEYMPFDGNKWDQKKMITYREMLNIIKEKYPDFKQLCPKLNETSKAYKVPNFSGQIGFITSMSENFCGTCNRLRITADGNLKVCLFGREEVSLRDAIRSGADNDQLIAMIKEALYNKKKQHAGALNIVNTTNRPMILIAQQRQYCTQSSHLTHIDESTGRAIMVDISDKQTSDRTATAIARVWVGPHVCQLIQLNQIKKGDALTVAQMAGIMAAKNTSNLIPLCHQIPLSNVSIDLVVDSNSEQIVITAKVKTKYETGVEMEALTAVSVAALTVYDMTKAVNKHIVIRDIKLISKTGGKQDIHS